MPSPNLRPIPRDKLFAVFKTEELVRLIEDILYTLNETIPGDTSAIEQALSDHIDDAVDAHQATAIGAIPGGSRVLNTVQGQLAELDLNKLAASLVSAYVLTLLDDPDAATARSTLGLGSMATQAASSVAITGGTIALASGSLGYATGSGGTVTQLGSKSTDVSLNKITGAITMDAAALAAGTSVSFTMDNTTVAAGDRIIVNHVSGGTFGAYHVDARALTGGATFVVRNLTAGSLSEAIVLGFTVIKSATA